MQRLDYQLTVHGDGAVQAVLDAGEERIPSETGRLDLSQFEALTRDLLPWLDSGSPQDRSRLARLGERLYQTLFAPPVQGHFEEQAWRKVEEHPDRFCLALSLALSTELRADVAALPWELLYCPRGQTFLATDRRVAFARRHADWVTARGESYPPVEALRILLIRLQSDALAPVALAPLTGPLNDLARNNSRLLVPIVLENPQPAEVEDALGKYRPHVAHLLLHGQFGERGTSFALINAAGQQVRWYGDRSLADLFQASRPRLVFLQACEGGRLSDVYTFAHGAAWLVRGHLPAVVAMRYPITNRIGWTFSLELYQRLVAGDEVDVAVQRARRALAQADQTASDDHSTRDFAAPLLWLQPEARRLFSSEEDTMTYSGAAAAVNGAPPALTRLIIETPEGARFETQVPPNTLVNQLLQALLEYLQPTVALLKPRRYELRAGSPPGVVLDPAATLKEAGILPDARLVLTSADLTGRSPVGLTIEDEAGRRFVTAVLLETSVRKLAEEFLQQTCPVAAGVRPVVQLVSHAGREPIRRLNLDASLYDEGIGDNAVLQIYAVAEQAQR